MSAIMDDIKTSTLSGPILIHGKGKISDYAYVLSVFKDSSYLLGALAAAFSIKQTGSPNDVVLMVTDIPNDMISLAKQVFDKIYSVPYIKVNDRPLRTEKQRERYGSWMSVACTKWNCLALVEYKKVMFVDADKIILTNVDHLFELPTPAGTFSSPQAKGYCKNGGMYNPYLKLREGDTVSDSMISDGLDGSKGSSFTVIGTMLILTPSADHYAKFKSMLESYKNKPFGYGNCNSSIDEQAIVHFHSRHLSGMKWTYISQKHQWICWKPEWLRDEERKNTVIHYFNLKAWKLNRSEWPDLQPWWTMVKLMLEKTKWNGEERERLEILYRKDQLEMKDLEGCFYCKLFSSRSSSDHSFMRADGSIGCGTWNSQK
jgi:hypothetical protein